MSLHEQARDRLSEDLLTGKLHLFRVVGDREARFEAFALAPSQDEATDMVNPSCYDFDDEWTIEAREITPAIFRSWLERGVVDSGADVLTHDPDDSLTMKDIVGLMSTHLAILEKRERVANNGQIPLPLPSP